MPDAEAADEFDCYYDSLVGPTRGRTRGLDGDYEA